MKKRGFLVLGGVFLIGLFFLLVCFNDKQVNIEKVLSSKYYSYLPVEAKDYIREVYDETGVVLLTEKNKKEGSTYLNPNYVNYLTNKSNDENGYVPSSVITEVKFDMLGASETLPSKYDLRNVDGVSYITSMKNQGDEDLCWDFANTGALESKILKEGLYSGSGELDLSERQIDYATAFPTNAIDIGKNPYRISNYWDRELGTTGADMVYRDAILHGVVPIYEKDWQYDYTYEGKALPVDVWNHEKVYYDVDGMYNFSSIANPDINFINNMKKLLMENGAIAVSIPIANIPRVTYEIGANEKPLIQGSTKNTLYYRSEGYRYVNGHEVMIIGWDDNYSHNICIDNTTYPVVSDAIYSNQTGDYSCSRGTLKTINGAWIAKNSYGSESNDAYFYIAFDSRNLDYANYYDVNIKKWDNVYYNKLLVRNLIASEKFNKLNNPEKLEKVKFYSKLGNINAVVKLSFDGSDNYTEVGNVEISYPGLYTLDLSSQNIVLNNDSFDVKINYLGKEEAYSSEGAVFTSNTTNDIEISIEDARVEQSFVYQNLISQDNIVVVNGESRNLGYQKEITYKVFDNSNKDVTSNFVFYRKYSVSNYINTIIGFNNDVSKGIYKIYAYVDNVEYDQFSLIIDNYFENISGDGSENNPYVIKNAIQLNMMRTSSRAFYKLGNNIDLAYDTTNTNGLFYNDGKGWNPIAFEDSFEGSFDGNNYEISNLYINRPNEDYVGLFRIIENGYYGNVYVKNLTLVNPNITGKDYVGAIAGYADGTTYERCLTLENVAVKYGNVSGNKYVGGVFGRVKAGTHLTGYCVSDGKNRHTINGFYNSATINSNNYSGGIIGMFDGMFGSKSAAYINNLQNHGKVVSDNIASGLIGKVNESDGNSITINNAINTGKLSGTKNYDLIGEFNQKNTGKLLLNNMYYLGSSAYPSNTAIESNNVSKKTIDQLKDSSNYTNWEKWEIKTVSNIKRLPILKFVNFNYTQLSKKTIENNGNISSLILPNQEAAKNVVYKITDSTIATINSDGTIVPKKIGETTVNILSNYDGFTEDIILVVDELNNAPEDDLTFGNESKTVTFSTSSQKITMTGASNGSGNYTYTEVSESNGSEATSYFTLSGTTITTKENTPAGSYTYKVKATDSNTEITKEKTITITINPLTITITFAKGSNVTSIGETSKTCLMSTSSGCKVTTPTITAEEGYVIVGWSKTNGDTSGVKAGSSVTVTKNTTYYANASTSFINSEEYVMSDEEIINIVENTSIANYKKKFNMTNDHIMKIFNKNNEELKDTEIVYTGSLTKVYVDNELNKTYVNIIFGDVTGEGLIKMNDVMKLATYIIDDSIMKESYYIKAGDFMRDDSIKMNDVMKLASYVLGGE